MNKLAQIWNRWTMPANMIPERDHFRVRFMAAMVLMLLFLGSAIQFANIAFAPKEERLSYLNAGALTAVILLIIYRAVRSRFYRPAGWLIILCFDVLTLLMVGNGQPPDLLNYLIIPLLLATFFTSIRNVIIIFAINSGVVLGLSQIVETVSVDFAWSTISYLLFITGILIGIAYYRDLWERENHKQLKESRERYRTLLTASFDGILMVQEGKIRIMNDGLLHLFGYEREEVIERPLIDLIPSIEQVISETAVLDIENGSSLHTLPGYTKEGVELNIEISVRNSTYFDEPAQLIAARDITERTKEATALQQSQARNQALLRATPDTMVRLSHNGTCTDYWPDDTFAKMLPFQQVFNQHITTIFPSEQAEKFTFFSKEALANGKTQFFECDLSSDDFTLIYEVRLTPISKQQELLALIRDVTEKKRAETMLFGLSQELETRVEERTLKLVEANKISETMQAANLALTKTVDLDIVLDTLLHYLAQLIPYDNANVMLWESDTHLRIYAMRGYELSTDPNEVENRLFDLSKFNSLAKVVETKSSLLVAATSQMPDWITIENIEYIQSWLGIPLIAGGRVIGLYALDHATPNAFTRVHQRYAEALAAQAAVAIQNARLFEQVRDGREKLRSLAQQVVMAQEEERTRVSRELHDEAGQALTALKISLALTLRTVSEQTDEAVSAQLLKKELQDAVNLCELTMDQIRQLAHNLRPAALDDLGLSPALEGFCDDFAERTRLIISFYSNKSVPTVSNAVGITLYRFLQETLTNVARHADATKIDVRLDVEEAAPSTNLGQAVTLSVVDNGQGFELSAEHLLTAYSSGIGLGGLQERLQLVGGELHITSNPEQGTLIKATIPCQEE